MDYDRKFKCVKEYREGKRSEKPDDEKCRDRIFRDKIRFRVRFCDLYHPDGLKHQQIRRE